ncbi:PTPLA-domain-containing protein [Coemansia reversa NRRL 1564]|uniref:Very-long-chain (3R)-3-hydroxyacyl-CoA dehydratase n=1 Tax=Coemansia reversa (strain ATCC 12441 / NRRL 1564) TaxID=763665 RepID=A0A2G5BL31_COERN|nr:PTPLA-domain-containing protein [Coemansia reversa NRRL 1564]|eukprot:PIA19682.1 PTPLA-domain-containing protein [Coemansia reversa NRRL 1564]
MAAGGKGNGIVESYLVAYNAVSFIGWAYVLIHTTIYLLEHGTDLSGLFDRIGYPLIFVQTGAALEIFHSLTGLVRSSALTVLMQVYSRLLLVWGTLYVFDYPEIRASYPLVLMVLAWSITECVRYSHYALSLLDIEIPVLLYLRYTLFYVLYPAGVTGELLEMWAALPHASAIRPSFKAFLLLNMINYPPVLYKLYTHMIRQRRKILGGKGGTKTNSKATTANAAGSSPAARKKKL